jgi:NADH-quinone oxidoreductase subunit A
MYFDYLLVLVFTAVGLVFVFANMVVGSIIRPKRKVTEGRETYECGEVTIGDAWISFDIRYYTVALVYVIFAVEIAFLFPWAIVLRDAMADPAIGVFALVEGVLFIAILFLGLAYVWAKGDLDWVLSYSGSSYQPRPRPRHRLPMLSELQAAEDAAAAAAQHGGDADSDKGDEEAA